MVTSKKAQPSVSPKDAVSAAAPAAKTPVAKKAAAPKTPAAAKKSVSPAPQSPAPVPKAAPAKKAAAAKQAAAKVPAKAASKAPAKKVAKKPETAQRAAKPSPRPEGLAIDAGQRANYIEVAAYYIAQRRGFTPGDPQQDYLDAAAEIDQLIAAGHFHK